MGGTNVFFNKMLHVYTFFVEFSTVFSHSGSREGDLLIASIQKICIAFVRPKKKVKGTFSLNLIQTEVFE